MAAEFIESHPGVYIRSPEEQRQSLLEQARYDILYRQDATFAQRLQAQEFGAYTPAELQGTLGPDALLRERDRIVNYPRGNKTVLDSAVDKVSDYLPQIVTAFLAWAGGIAVAGAAGGGAAAAAGEGTAAAAGEGAAAAGEGAGAGVVEPFDYSYLDPLEAGDVFYGNELLTFPSATTTAAGGGVMDKALDFGADLAKKYVTSKVLAGLAPKRPDIASPAPGAAPVAAGFAPSRYAGQRGDALGSMFSPAAQKNLLILAGLLVAGVIVVKVAAK